MESVISVLYVDLFTRQVRKAQFPLKGLYILSHVLPALGTKSSKLNLVRARLIDFDNIDPSNKLEKDSKRQGSVYSRFINNVSLLDLPFNDLSINSRFKSSREPTFHLDVVAQSITLGDGSLVSIPKQSPILLNRVARLFEQRRHGDRVM